MDPFFLKFGLVLEELLEKKNLEENLSKLIRLLEDEIDFQSLGIFLNVPRSDIYRIKISRHISYHYAKSTVFRNSDQVVKELKHNSEIELRENGRIKFEKKYSHLIVYPLVNNDLFQGFIFLDKEEGEFTAEDLIKIRSVSTVISMGVDLDNMREELAHSRSIDNITGFLTYKAFFESAENQFTLMKRYNRPMTMIILKLDEYEKIIRTIGSENCDSLLRLITKNIRGNLRDSDIMGKLYRDLFGILMPETTIQNGLIAVKRMDEIINNIEMMENKNIGWGLIEMDDRVSNVDDLIAKARESAQESCRKNVYKYTIYQDDY